MTTAAETDPTIFAHMPFPVAERGYRSWFDWLRAEQAAGRCAVLANDYSSKRIIQGTNLLDDSAAGARQVYPGVKICGRAVSDDDCFSGNVAVGNRLSGALTSDAKSPDIDRDVVGSDYEAVADGE